MDTSLLSARPATLDRAKAPTMLLLETLWLFLATCVQTNNRCSFLEQVMPKSLVPPTHRRTAVAKTRWSPRGSKRRARAS